MSLNAEFCCGFHRSHSEAGHVVPCLCRGPQGVCSPHRPEPDQFVVPWTYTVGERHVFKLTYSKREMMNDKWIVGSSYIGGSYSSCSVQIRVVKLSDAGEYHFRFETDQPLGRWTSPDTITLDVTGRSTAVWTPASVSVSMSVCVSDLQVQVHPTRPANMFGLGETVFVGCQARGCAAPGRSLALYRCVLCMRVFYLQWWMYYADFTFKKKI